MEHPVDVSALPPGVQKVCGPQAPPQLKQMAASGLAPLGPTDLVTALYVLAFDADAAIAKQAQGSLEKVPENVLHGALEQDLGVGVLDGLARLLVGKGSAVERLLLNQVVADETVCWLVPNVRTERLLEIVAGNEQRLLRAPEIIEALYMNKHTRMSTVDRAVELAVRNGIELTGIPTFAEIKAAIEGELIVEAEEEPTPDDLIFTSVLAAEDLADLSEDLVEDALESTAGQEQETETEKRVKSAEQSLANLTVSQKIRVAMLGNASQRSILIRDSNKMVSMAVLKAPGIGESEVIRYAQARSLPEEAIRYIASRREWTKQYQVKLNLVKNPRTPLQDAMRFLNHLRPNDIRGLMTSRDVPQAISRAAKSLRDKRSF